MSANSPIADRSLARLVTFGLADYGSILDLQRELHSDRAGDRVPDTWLAGEHPLVITAGVRATETDVISAGAADVPIVRIDRGGMTTLHNPGQLVLYPIVKLAMGSVGAGAFARRLVEAAAAWIETEWGVRTENDPARPGLYHEGRKLLSVGLSGRGGVTMHGVALNMNNDLTDWQRIVACGNPGVRPVSISDILAREVRPAHAVLTLADWLSDSWDYGETVRESHKS